MILALGIILGAGLTIFTFENSGYVTVSMLAQQFSAPMALVLVGVIGVSALATFFALLPSILRHRSDIRKLNVEKKVLEQELAKYHTVIPVAASGTHNVVVAKEPVAVAYTS